MKEVGKAVGVEGEEEEKVEGGGGEKEEEEGEEEGLVKGEGEELKRKGLELGAKGS